MIQIDICAQTLGFFRRGVLQQTFNISSAKNGIGNLEGSHCTPSGNFRICAAIGAGLPLGAVLVGRVATGEIYTPELGRQFLERDWILSRILWLEGLDEGNQNTRARYIYIHGTADGGLEGAPNSHGCIRMRNADIMALFEWVGMGEYVAIIPNFVPEFVPKSLR